MSRRLLDKNFCIIPWTGFELEPDGHIKNCIISAEKIGSIHKESIENIIQRNPIRKQMLEGKYPSNCKGCYLQEKHRTNSFESISSRLYYTKELANSISKNLFDNDKNFELRHIDLRWNNLCNQACVYCSPEYSSKWAQELNENITKNKENIKKIKDYVYKNIKTIKNVYLAGGEPLLMNDNKEFLSLLFRENPDATVRVNTNLSKTNTGVFEQILKFKNVHWTISVETIADEYEYIRHHGKWKDFLENLQIIQKLPHRISFNMLYFILNYKSIFPTVRFFQELGYHNNSFIIGPLLKPSWLSILNLPTQLINECRNILIEEIDKKPGFLLQNSYENLLSYLTDSQFHANIETTKKELGKMDKRRNLDSSKIFTQLYEEAF